MPEFVVFVFALSDFADSGWDQSSTQLPASTGNTLTFNGDPADRIPIRIDDDDLSFQDGISETGNSAVLTDPVTIDGVTFAAGSVVELEFVFRDENADADPNQTDSPVMMRIDGVNVGYAFTQAPQTGDTWTNTVGDADVPAALEDGDNYFSTPEFTDHSSIQYSSVICFCTGTLIETESGPRRIEDLRQGDLVLTKDNGLQELRRIGRRTITCEEIRAYPGLRPIRIRAGALSGAGPDQDLLVSPQHRILVRSRIAQRMFGEYEVLVAAKHLLPLDAVETTRGAGEVVYIHFMFDRHEIVFANGVETESLCAGPQALRSMPEESRSELFLIFPELAGGEIQMSACRAVARGRLGRRLAQRHQKNAMALVNRRAAPAR